MPQFDGHYLKIEISAYYSWKKGKSRKRNITGAVLQH
jgi:hypothetical protein